jgi:hypothetical protein
MVSSARAKIKDPAIGNLLSWMCLDVKSILSRTLLSECVAGEGPVVGNGDEVTANDLRLLMKQIPKARSNVLFKTHLKTVNPSKAALFQLFPQFKHDPPDKHDKETWGTLPKAPEGRKALVEYIVDRCNTEPHGCFFRFKDGNASNRANQNI